MISPKGFFAYGMPSQARCPSGCRLIPLTHPWVVSTSRSSSSSSLSLRHLQTKKKIKISLYTFVHKELSTFLPKTSYAQQYHNSCQNGRISVPRHVVCNVTQPGYGVRCLCDWPCAKYPTVANILAHALQNSKIALRNVSH